MNETIIEYLPYILGIGLWVLCWIIGFLVEGVQYLQGLFHSRSIKKRRRQVNNE